MSSEPAMTPPASRCLFCSLGCELGLEQFAPQRWRPHLGQTGPCSRGQVLADLVQSGDRLYRPWTDAGPTRLPDALRLLHERVTRPGARTTIWLDGNVSLEDLSAAHAFGEQRGEDCTLLMHLPPAELGAVEALEATGTQQTAPEAWTDADAFIIVGNPLATHPGCTRKLLRHGHARANTPVVVIDSSAGYLTTYTPHALLCRPGYEPWVVAALLAATGFEGVTPGERIDNHAQVLADAQIQQATVQRAADALREARRPAVVIAPQSGSRVRWRALTAHAAAWVAERRGGLTVLTTSANALAVVPLMRKLGRHDWSSAMEAGGDFATETLLVVGWDPTSAAPRAVWQPVFDQAERVVFAGTFLPADPAAYDAWLPLALGSEAGGTYVLADGQRHAVHSILPPPDGVITTRELFAHLAGAAADEAFRETPDGEQDSGHAPLPAEALPPPEPIPAHSWPAVLSADPTQYADGQMTRHALWSQRAELLPELRMARDDARRLGLADGEITTVQCNGREARVRVGFSTAQPVAGVCYGPQAGDTSQPSGWMAIQGSSAEVRALGGARLGESDASTEAGIIHITLTEGPARVAPREAEHGHR